MSEEEKEKIETDKSTGNLSRREFLRDAGLVVGGATIGSVAILSSCGTAKTETVTETATKTVSGAGTTVTVTGTGAPGATTTKTVSVTTTAAGPTVTTTKITEVAAAIPVINLTLNGGKYTLPVLSANETLRELLRDELGITSLKEMCSGEGACGSCTAIVDGRPVLSCMMLAIECNGKVILTAEGVAKANPKLIDAYVYNHAMQCGYCTPGFVCTSQALIARIPKPTEADIREALGGNICRCVTYPYHILAIQEATAQRTPSTGKPV